VSDIFFGETLHVPDKPETPAPVKDEVGPVYHHDLVQGTDEWLQTRLGLLTASEMKKQFTASLARANNDTSRGHVYEIMGERISQDIGDNFMSYDMARGHQEEELALDKYSEKYEQVTACGFDPVADRLDCQ